MSNYLPCGGFEWGNSEYFDEMRMLKTKDDQKIEYLYEVDLKYPKE